MKRLSSLVLAVLLLIGTFVSIPATASANNFEKYNISGAAQYVQLSWPGDSNTYLLDVENNGISTGTRVIAFPYKGGGSANQQWNVGDATANRFSVIISNRDPGTDKLLALSLDYSTKKLVTLVYNPDTTLPPDEAKWKIDNGQLINKKLSAEGRNPNYVLTPFKESVINNNTALKYILPQPVVKVQPSVNAAPSVNAQ